MKSAYESPFLDQEALEFLQLGEEEDLPPTGLAETSDYIEAELLTEQDESPRETRFRLKPQGARIEDFEAPEESESVTEEGFAGGEDSEPETTFEEESLPDEEAADEADFAFEALESDNYPVAQESEAVEEEAVTSFESLEEEQDWELDFEEESILNEEVAAAPEPIAVPRTNPIPFAPPPKGAAYWPVRTAGVESREVNYRQIDGTLVGKRRTRRFLAPRSSARRIHLGVDLNARVNDPVLACETGTVVAFYAFSCRRGKTNWALLVEHPEVVVMYGEIATDSLERAGLRKGSKVNAGQIIGYVARNAGKSGLLHFETWAKGTPAHQEWILGGRRPQHLLNPTRYLLALT